MRKQFMGLIVILLLVSQCFAEDFGPYFKNMLESGQDVILKDCIITNDLLLEMLDLPRDGNNRAMINSSIKFDKCEIKGNINFADAIFKRPLIFKDMIFSGDAYFSNAKFEQDGSFFKGKFMGMADFNNANFTGHADFRNSEFDSSAIFTGARFSRPAYFRDTKFNEDAYFRNAYSQNMIDFEGATFYKSAIFSNANFNNIINLKAINYNDISNFNDVVMNGNITLMNSIFYNDAYFYNSTFRRITRFDNAKFLEMAKFADSKFGGDADFTGSKFQGPVDFNSANFSENCSFDGVEFNKIAKFDNANFSGSATFFGAFFQRDAQFEGASFKSKLNLTDATFSRLALSWEAIRGHLIKGKGTNISLINNYKNIVWIKDRNQCYYDYRYERMITSQWGKSKILDYASWIYWGYGIRPYNALINIVAVIFLFGLLYFWLVRSKLAQIARKSSNSDSQSRYSNDISFLEALFFSARILGTPEVFMDVISFVSIRLSWQNPPEDLQIEGDYARLAIWTQRVIFGFFIVLFIVFFSDEVQSYFKPPV
jgi:hypothetical protein